MSDLERRPVEGVIDITEMPYDNAEQAREAVHDAFTLLRDGAERVEEGTRLLERAKRREAWKVLGFTSWGALVLDGIEQHLKHVLDPGVRYRLAVEMRVQDQASVRAIAEAMDVSHVTIMRDLRAARAIGDLYEEDEPRPPRDSPAAASRPPAPRNGQMEPRRPDLGRVFKGHSHEIARRARIMSGLREDDRYARRLADVAVNRGDLEMAYRVIGEILADFDALD